MIAALQCAESGGIASDQRVDTPRSRDFIKRAQRDDHRDQQDRTSGKPGQGSSTKLNKSVACETAGLYRYQKQRRLCHSLCRSGATCQCFAAVL